MPFAPLEDLLPDVARNETRSVLHYEDGEVVRAYLFAESFCNEVGCDCRRVFIQVMSDERGVPQPRATIAWGWEPAAFYRKWASFPLTGEDIEELKGPALPRLTVQSEEAPALLERFRELLEDEAYRARIVRHYEAFRTIVEERGTRSGRAKLRKRKVRGRVRRPGRQR